VTKHFIEVLWCNRCTFVTSLFVIGGNEMTTPALSTRHGYNCLPFSSSKYLTSDHRNRGHEVIKMSTYDFILPVHCNDILYYI